VITRRGTSGDDDLIFMPEYVVLLCQEIRHRVAAHVDQPPAKPDLFFGEYKADPLLTLDVEFPPNMSGHILKNGTYLFHLILAAANGRPHHYRLKVTFFGKWFDEEQEMFSKGIEIQSC
jgi:hypothetical protein